MVFPRLPSLPSVAFAISLAICLWLLSAERRRFLLGWLAGSVAFAANPLVMPLVVQQLSTWNGYWRVFYTLPFPLTLGVAAALLADRHRLSPRAVLASAGLLVLGTAAANALAPGLTTLGGLRFELAGYKLPPGIHEELREIAAHATPGSMLAPYDISSTLPFVTSAFPQVSVERYFLIHFSRLQGHPESADSRHRAALYAGGRSPLGLADVERLIDEGLANVVVVRFRSFDPGLVGMLARYGFRRELELRRLVLYRRDGRTPG